MEQESKQPKATSMTQQKMKAFQPIHTLHSTLLVFIAAGLTFFCFGSIFSLQATLSTDLKSRYDDLPQCVHSPTCEFQVSVPSGIFPPVFVYYELHDFYQNHRQFVKSRDYKQLFGEERSVENVTGTCGEVVEMEDVDRNVTVGGVILPPNSVANPCGLVAKTLFNDTYSFFLNSSAPIFLNQTDIAWKADSKFVYNRNSDYLQTQWVDVEDEHFQVWMRTALLPNFRKLWARIEEPIEAGNYTVRVENNFNVSVWHGEKYFVLSTANSLGGTTQTLGYFLLTGAVGCLFIVILFVIKSKLSPIPPYDDLDSLHWD